MFKKSHPIEKLLRDGSNCAFVTNTQYLKYLEKSFNGTKKFTVLKERILSEHWGFMFHVTDYMYKTFNRRIIQLVESGISDLMIRQETKVIPKIEEYKDTPLGMEHLENWFIILLIMLGICTFTFLSENLCFRLKNMRSRKYIKKTKVHSQSIHQIRKIQNFIEKARNKKPKKDPLKKNRVEKNGWSWKKLFGRFLKFFLRK